MQWRVRRLGAVLSTVLLGHQAMAFDAFVVSQIEVDGLQRINSGTVYNYLPIKVGDRVDESRTQAAIAELYATGFFKDIRLLQDGNVLIVDVVERPSIASIDVDGNNKIGSEDLLEALKQIGLAEGKIFDRSLLDKIQQDLQRQYFALGHYAVVVESGIKPVGENRVAVTIDIKEGQVAKIQHVNVVGNTVYDDKVLLDDFKSGPRPQFSLFSGRDKYSRQKLSGDLETLRSYYLDRGYINFNIESTQVSISPDRSEVYLSINVSEGEQYTISEVKLAGDLVVGEEALDELVMVDAGDIFSRRRTQQVSQAITDRLGEEGYAFANVNAIPDIDRDSKTVGLTFFVDPGKRIYVRRINISGNERTDDEVIRREVRQMESAWLSSKKLNRSRVRVQRLSYLGSVNVETPSVPGTDDQVDVDISVTEQLSGSLLVGVGFSDSSGALFNASVTQDNFLGTGKRVVTEVNTSQVNTVYSFSYTNPYHTLNGVSRTIRAFLRETDTSDITVADFSTDVWGGGVTYGIPLSEFNTLRLGVDFEHISVNTSSFTPDAYVAFLEDNGDEYDLMKLTVGWSHDTRNRTVFASRGILQNLTAEVILPFSDLQFFKTHSRTQWFHPLTNFFTLSLNGELSYGEAYSDETSDLPFFEKYFAGGARSVRGYEASSLGPREDNVALGGNFRVVGNAELVFPPPFASESTTVRMSLFFDVGNVFETIEAYDSAELRQSVGVSLLWLSPIGPLSFSIADALNNRSGDDTETFQFTLGTFF